MQILLIYQRDVTTIYWLYDGKLNANQYVIFYFTTRPERDEPKRAQLAYFLLVPADSPSFGVYW